MANARQVKDFIDLIAPITVACCNAREKKILPSVCIAQAGCESAYGTNARMKNARAIFGIKVGKNKVKFGKCWKGKAYSTKTKECYDGSTYVTITDMFRAYDTLADSVGDYYDMLGSCTRYAKCLNVTDPRACITEIKNGGYATSPTYVNTIMTIIEKYNLTQYDDCMVKITIDRNPFTEPTRDIRKGCVGNDVKWVQWYLWRFGLFTKNGLADSTQIDGIFGSNSDDKTKIAQRRLGLPDTGVITKKVREVFKGVV